MHNRHAATVVLLLTLVLGACGSGASEPKASGDTPNTSAPAVVSTTTTAARPPSPTVRTDDLDADLQSVDRDLSGAQQSVNQATDTSPDRADD